jgi:hypothetical protein
MEALIGLVVGAFVTWACSDWYYKRAGDDLKREARRLHVALSAVVYKLEYPDAQVEATRDADGAVTGLVVRLHGVTTASPFATGNLTLTVEPSPPKAGSEPVIVR